MASQISSDWMYGTLNEQTIRLSEMISKAVPVAEHMRYVASGTEAAMYAVRLARAETGRRIIAKVDGGWHGYTSDLLKTVNWPFSEPESTGMVNDDQIVSVPIQRHREGRRHTRRGGRGAGRHHHRAGSGRRRLHSW